MVRLAASLAQTSQSGLPAARAGVHGVTAARRVLARRRTAACVPAEFKTMALSFGAGRLLDTVLRPDSSAGLARLRFWSVAGSLDRKVWAESSTISGCLLRQTRWAASAVRCPYSLRDLSRGTQWKVLVTFLSIWLYLLLWRALVAWQSKR